MNQEPPDSKAPLSVHRRWRRRWGVIFITASLLMLVLGVTRFDRALHGVAFLAYWFVCALAAGFAIVVAGLEAASVQVALRREERALAQAALRDIQEAARRRVGESGAGAGRGPSGAR